MEDDDTFRLSRPKINLSETSPWIQKQGRGGARERALSQKVPDDDEKKRKEKKH